MHTFRQLIKESSFETYSKEELELLLKHHEEDKKEYDGNTSMTAYQSSVKDIKLIKKALDKLK